MLREIGVTGGTGIIGLIAAYFVIKWAVKNAILEAHYAITGEKSEEEKEVEAMMAADAEKRQSAMDEYHARKEARRAAKAAAKEAKRAAGGNDAQ